MSERSLRTVLAVLGGLIVIYAVAAVASRAPRGASAEDAAVAEALGAFREGGLAEVRIIRPDDTVELSRAGGGWVVNGYPADSAAVARLEETLAEARVGHLAAANPSNHARLGVAEDSARLLELTHEEGGTVRLLVGDAGPSYPSAYVRLPGADETYLVHGDLRGPVRRDPDEWRDRTIIRVDTAAVARIAVTGDAASYTLVRDSAGWRLADADAPAQERPVQDILSELADLQAAGFAEDGTRPGVAARTIVAYSGSGDELARVTLAEGDGSNFLVTAPGREAVFELASWRADRLAPERAEVEGSGTD